MRERARSCEREKEKLREREEKMVLRKRFSGRVGGKREEEQEGRKNRKEE